MKLKTLSIITFFLFALSLLVFWQENRRPSGIIEGSDYIRGLDIEQLARIKLTHAQQEVELTRTGDIFVLERHQQYPASSERVNELIYKIAMLQVAKVISENPSPDEMKKLLLDKTNATLVELYDRQQKLVASFRIGKSYHGRGHYLYKDSTQQITLSTKPLYISAMFDSYVDHQLAWWKKEEIKSVKSAQKSIENKQDIRVNFTKFFVAGDNKVADLAFHQRVDVELIDGVIYHLLFAKKKKNYYLQITADVNELSEPIAIKQDDGKDKLDKVDKIIKAQAKAQRFNALYSRWTYQITQQLYDQFFTKKTKK